VGFPLLVTFGISKAVTKGCDEKGVVEKGVVEKGVVEKCKPKP
jgi:hypothetical protein